MAKTFGAQSTTEDVLDGVNLSGQRFFVTGGSAGLGVETVRALAPGKNAETWTVGGVISGYWATGRLT